MPHNQNNKMEELKKFIEGFFQNMKCTLSWRDNALIVENVPKDFEDFYGKKAPFHFIFGEMACPMNEDCEIVTKGSFILKIISGYLENRGQTTLLKINFEPLDFKQILKLKNCSILKSSCKINHETFCRFTFITNLQYLNEREQIITPIFEQGYPDFNQEDYLITEGIKNEISLGDIKDKYSIAKETLKVLLQPKIQKAGEQLDKKLEIEVRRIKAHYQNQKQEIYQELKKVNDQLVELEAGNTAGDLKNIPARLNRLTEQQGELQKKIRLEESGEGPLAKEEKFFIADEIHKHSLNIDNKLMNTTIFYYPLFCNSVFLKSDSAGRQIEIIYDPLKREISPIECESCKQKLNEISLCSTGHLTCQNCLTKCRECNEDFCNLCLDKTCSYCGKKICRKCASTCAKCMKTYCKSHIKKSLEGRNACLNCLKSCSSCGSSSENMRKCPNCSKEFCINCANRNIITSNGKTFCSSCSVKCPTCLKLFAKTSLAKCPGCKAEVCNHLQKCPSCRKQLCPKLRR